jgi:hypothetical protein
MSMTYYDAMLFNFEKKNKFVGKKLFWLKACRKIIFIMRCNSEIVLN